MCHRSFVIINVFVHFSLTLFLKSLWSCVGTEARTVLKVHMKFKRKIFTFDPSKISSSRLQISSKELILQSSIMLPLVGNGRESPQLSPTACHLPLLDYEYKWVWPDIFLFDSDSYSWRSALKGRIWQRQVSDGCSSGGTAANPGIQVPWNYVS